MAANDYTTADMRALAQCKRCAAVIDARNKARHSAWHRLIDLAITAEGINNGLDSTEDNQSPFPF